MSEQTQQEKIYYVKNATNCNINKKLFDVLWENRGEKFHLGDRRKDMYLETTLPSSIRVINPKKWSRRKALNLTRSKILVMFNYKDKAGDAYFFNIGYIENFIKERKEYIASLPKPPTNVALALGLV